MRSGTQNRLAQADRFEVSGSHHNHRSVGESLPRMPLGQVRYALGPEETAPSRARIFKSTIGTADMENPYKRTHASVGHLRSSSLHSFVNWPQLQSGDSLCSALPLLSTTT